MKTENRPIIVFNGNITPTLLSNAIPRDFDGDVVINGMIDNPNLSENASLILKLGKNGCLWVRDGIYTLNEINVYGNVYCYEGDIIAGDYIKVDGFLYSKLGIEAFDVSVSKGIYSGGKLIVADLAVGGNLEAETFENIALCNIKGTLILHNGLSFDNY